MDRVNEVINELRSQGEERDKLLDELEHSLMIEKMCPEAFDYGKCKTSWKWIEDGKYHHAAMIITRGDGHEIMFDLEDVPSKVLKSAMKARGFTGHLWYDKNVRGYKNRINKAIISRCKMSDVKNETTPADRRMNEGEDE